MKKFIMMTVVLLLFCQLGLAQNMLNEGFESGQIPMNWTNYNYLSENGWEIHQMMAHTGNYSVGIPSAFISAMYNDWLVTPALMPANGDSISFWMNSGSVGVLLSTAGKDTADFTNFLGFVQGNWEWQQASYDLSNYAGDTVYVAFVIKGMFGSNVPELDDIAGPEIYLDPTPVFVTGTERFNFNQQSGLVRVGETVSHPVSFTNLGGNDLVVSNITTSSPDISPSVTTVTVPYGVNETVDFSWTPSAAGKDSGWIAFEHNGASGSDTIYFDYQSVPQNAFVIDFEAPEEQWFKPTGYGLTLDGVWESDDWIVHWGNYSLQKSGWSGGDTSYIYTPRLDLSGDVVNLAFYYAGQMNAQDTVLFEISSDGGTSWNEIGYVLNDSEEWQYQEYDLSAYAGNDDCRIRWHYIGGAMAAEGSTVHLDDIVLPERYLNPQGVVYTDVEMADFGNLLVGESESMQITLMNAGSPLTINSITSDNPDFAVSNVPATVDPYGSASFTVTFTPSAGGDINGTISIDHDGVNGTETVLTVAAAGYGLEPQLLPFADDYEDDSSLLNYRFVKSETGTIEISGETGSMNGGAFSGSQVLKMTGNTGAGENQVKLYLDMSTYSSVRLSYAWGMSTYNQNDYIKVDIYDGQWHNGVDSLSVSFAAGNRDTWFLREVDLSGYNKTADFVVRISTKISSDYASAYLDMLTVAEIPDKDYAVLNWVDFIPVGVKDSAMTCLASVRNKGAAAQTDVPVRLFADDAQVGADVLVSLAPNEIDTVEFTYIPAATGEHTLRVESFLDGDTLTANNTISGAVNVVPNSLPFADGLETGASLKNYIFSADSGVADFVINEGMFDFPAFEGDSMLAIYSRENGVRTEALADLYVDISAAQNPEISFALGCRNLEIEDSVSVDIYDGAWHKNVIPAISGTEAMALHTLNVESMGWNKVSNFVVRFRASLDDREWSGAAYVDAISVEDVLANDLKILISEFVVTPTDGEFIEIYNPNNEAVNLSDYYLTDATFDGGGAYYYNIVTGENYGGGGFGDFHARFPENAIISAGEYQTIALAGDSLFYDTYQVMPTYELFDDGNDFPSDAADMREAVSGSINHQGGLTNSDEVIVLYRWNGISDLVEDVDYVIYNGSSSAPNEAVDKTGIKIDGPDANTDSTEYLADTPIASQLAAPAHGYGFSTHRIDFTEGSQTDSLGNGITGADETSENLDVTFTANSLPSPNAEYAEPLYSISGSVHLEDTTGGLAGSIVTLQGPADEIRHDTTGISGSYAFNQLAVGTYTLRFKHLGFVPADTTLMLDQDVNYTPTLMLSPFVLNEDFEDGSLPYGWTRSSLGVGWLIGDSAALSSDYFAVPGNSIFAAANDDAAGADNNGSQDFLVTPPLKMSRLQNAILRFNSYFTGAFGQLAMVKISEDGGNNWQTLLNLTAGAAWTDQQVDLAAYSGAGHDSVLIAFHSDDAGDWATGWAIDNVRIGEKENGSIAGTVTASTGAAAIDSALVTVGEQSVYTDINGNYQIDNILIGQYSMEVRKSGYNTALVDSIIVNANAATTVDVALTAPTMEFDLAAIDTSVVAGDSVVVPLTLSNNGDGPLDFMVSILHNPVEKTDYSRFSKNVTISATAQASPKKGRTEALHENTRGGTVVHYDGENDAGVGLDGPGSWISAVRFTATELANYYDAYAMTAVQLYASSSDFTNITLKIWEGSIDGTPGLEVYSEDITSAVQIAAWTSHQLQYPVMLTAGKEYWVGYAIDATADHPAGADAGPVIPGKGAWIYFNGAWVELNTVGVNRNWNIRAMLEPLGGGDNWIYASPLAGTVLPGEQKVIEVLLDADQIYRADSLMTAALNVMPYPAIGDVSIPVNLTVTGVSGIDPQNSVPTSFALQQNYPNPFNPTTTIKYQLPKASDVSLTIYNVMGQKVRTLLNSRKDAGYHSVVWDGLNDNGHKVATGIYLYRLQAGDFVRTFKMVLMK